MSNVTFPTPSARIKKRAIIFVLTIDTRNKPPTLRPQPTFCTLFFVAMVIEGLPPRDVTCFLSYFVDQNPYFYVADPSEGVPRTTLDENLKPCDDTIHDARGKKDSLSLDTTGFASIRWSSMKKTFGDEEAIKS
ncbi:hypothetical protein CONPUDRAFT_157064 [Coniophora puteana RWD-64-598 SS2]|uniref:Uncharacterized protein n=1 Tax=Coniophora puteana (strain RWD-64-598) TaxID=741705 RepID=A0A5M3MFV6_CONPW|nr:uncharacterized protein CONPUDRAFT_157064 [Coniophora puteana RWD-64-598 SS2]EIW77886.1 hypothetical protein CONPUDRAFT_157064 [Coniophora puteana RWD-64-598 SS2]